MLFVGNLNESSARHYNDRRYTHTSVVHGKEVRYYDCWTNEDQHRPAFGDTLDKKKVSDLDRHIRNNSMGGDIPE